MLILFLAEVACGIYVLVKKDDLKTIFGEGIRDVLKEKYKPDSKDEETQHFVTSMNKFFEIVSVSIIDIFDSQGLTTILKVFFFFFSNSAAEVLAAKILTVLELRALQCVNVTKIQKDLAAPKSCTI